MFCILTMSQRQVLAGKHEVCNSYAANLRTMAEVDQSLRARWDYSTIPTHASTASRLPRIVQQTMLVDTEHTRRLMHLIANCGWPNRSVHGAQAVNDAWLLAQHSDPDPKLRKTIIDGMEAAIKEGHGSKAQLAYYIDRGLIWEKKPQIYGTQLKVFNTCKYEFEPYDDRRKVEERRKSIGLGTLDDYMEQIVASLGGAECGVKQPH